MHDADRGLDVAGLGWRHSNQIAMHADDGLDVRAASRQFKNIAAAEAEACGRLAAEIANAALVAFLAQGFERRVDAAATFRCVGA